MAFRWGPGGVVWDGIWWDNLQLWIIGRLGWPFLICNISSEQDSEYCPQIQTNRSQITLQIMIQIYTSTCRFMEIIAWSCPSTSHSVYTDKERIWLHRMMQIETLFICHKLDRAIRPNIADITNFLLQVLKESHFLCDALRNVFVFYWQLGHTYTSGFPNGLAVLARLSHQTQSRFT